MSMQQSLVGRIFTAEHLQECVSQLHYLLHELVLWLEGGREGGGRERGGGRRERGRERGGKDRGREGEKEEVLLHIASSETLQITALFTTNIN